MNEEKGGITLGVKAKSAGSPDKAGEVPRVAVLVSEPSVVHIRIRAGRKCFGIPQNSTSRSSSLHPGSSHVHSSKGDCNLVLHSTELLQKHSTPPAILNPVSLSVQEVCVFQ